MASSFRSQLADVLTLPLHLRARSLAEGLFAGAHRASTRGAGIEFAGHRAYTPGDDLRHLDRHAQLRHNRLLIRQFQTDTDRSLHVICDVSSSMNYADSGASSPSKLDLALLLSASLAYVSHRGGDKVGLTLVRDQQADTVALQGQGAPLDQLIECLEDCQRPALLASSPIAQSGDAPFAQLEDQWLHTLDHLGNTLKRGSVVVILSDFLDLSSELTRGIAHLTSRGRSVRCAQILTNSETNFPFDGVLRFYDPETGQTVQTDAQKARALYQTALHELTAPLASKLSHTGGRFLRLSTDTPPDRALAQLAAELPPGSA